MPLGCANNCNGLLIIRMWKSFITCRPSIQKQQQYLEYADRLWPHVVDTRKIHDAIQRDDAIFCRRGNTTLLIRIKVLTYVTSPIPWLEECVGAGQDRRWLIEQLVQRATTRVERQAYGTGWEKGGYQRDRGAEFGNYHGTQATPRLSDAVSSLCRPH